MDKYQRQLEFENPFLATLMKDNALIEELTITPDDFIDHRNQAILQTMKRNKDRKKPFDMMSLMVSNQDDMYRMGGREHIKAVFQTFMTFDNFHFLQDSIREFNAIEQARLKAQNFLESTKNIHESEKLDEFNESLEVIQLKKTDKREPFSKKVEQRAIDHTHSVADGLSGYSTGFLNLNRVTQGYQPKKLYIIGARPSVGKTAFSLNSMYDGMKNDNIFPTYISLETAAGDLIDRLISKLGRINLMKIKNVNKYLANEKDEYDKYTKVLNHLRQFDMDINETANKISKIRSVVRRNVKEQPDKKHVVFVDYLTLIKPARNLNNDIKEIGEVTEGLKQLAKDFNCSVVALAQLTRGVENRQDKRPVMSDLRGGGEIEQIADFIGFLYREDYQNSESDNKDEVELIIQKHRDGPVGSLKYKFMKQIQNFIEIDERML